MNKSLLTLIALFCCSYGFSQMECHLKLTTHGPDSHTPLVGNAAENVLQEAHTGKVFLVTSSNQSYAGNPFLFNDWRTGAVILDNGTEFKDIMLKFDILNNKFCFNRNDTSFDLPDNVAEVIMSNDKEIGKDFIFKKILSGNKKLQKGLFVQVLSEGKISLLKQYTKRVEGENFTNGIITTEKKVMTYNNLWAVVNDKLIAVKLNAKSLEELTDRLVDIRNYVKSKSLNLKNEIGFATAITYYNNNFQTLSTNAK